MDSKRIGIICALVTVAAVTAQYDTDPSNQPSNDCLGALGNCSMSTLTSGRCRSAYSALSLNLLRHDVDNNCKVSGYDRYMDSQDNFDQNGDSLVCRDEWVARYVTYFGFTQEFALSTWEWMSPSKSCLELFQFEMMEPDRDLDHYKDRMMTQLVRFCEVGDNMRTNRDCQELPAVCEVTSQYSGCTQVSSNYMSLRQKVMALQSAMDPNNDNNVTLEEVRQDFSQNYDTNGDGCVSEKEWTSRWVSKFGFSVDVATQFYPADTDNNGCTNVADLLFPEQGLPADTFSKGIISALQQKCESQHDSQYSNPDCAQLDFTCRTHFSGMEECTYYVTNCGIAQYSACVEELRSSFCNDCKDELFVDMELARVKNQLAERCIPGPVRQESLDVTDSSSTVQLTTVVLTTGLVAALTLG